MEERERENRELERELEVASQNVPDQGTGPAAYCSPQARQG